VGHDLGGIECFTPTQPGDELTVFLASPIDEPFDLFFAALSAELLDDDIDVTRNLLL
jgi:hypothetical protein